MIELQEDSKKLIYYYEVLRARFEIRDFFLKTSVLEVYENIGQVLSLVRMQLSLFDPFSPKKSFEDITNAGELVGQSIRDLRMLCSNFYPDETIVHDGGFTLALEQTMRMLQLPFSKIKTTGHELKIPSDLKLIIFKMLQEILVTIKEQSDSAVQLSINFKNSIATYTFKYNSNNLQFSSTIIAEDGHTLSLLERVKLINAELIVTQTKTKQNLTKLIVPIK